MKHIDTMLWKLGLVRRSVYHEVFRGWERSAVTLGRWERAGEKLGLIEPPPT